MGCQCGSGEQKRESSQVWSRLARLCCGATDPCFSKCDDVGFVVVGQVVECGYMFRDEHGASVEGADEEVCRVGWTWIGLDIPTEKQCGDE